MSVTLNILVVNPCDINVVVFVSMTDYLYYDGEVIFPTFIKIGLLFGDGIIQFCKIALCSLGALSEEWRNTSSRKLYTVQSNLLSSW